MPNFEQFRNIRKKYTEKSVNTKGDYELERNLHGSSLEHFIKESSAVIK
jgi:hypothetical protein